MHLTVPGRRAVVIHDDAGRQTPAGRYYYDRLGEAPLDRGFDHNQPPKRIGSQEYATLHDGTRKLVRNWNGRHWVFSKFGK